MIFKRNLIFIVALLCTNAIANNETISSKCDAIYYENGFAAGFPIIKKKEYWEWYKKSHPEYIWSMELGFYKDKKFTSAGLGISISIGTMNLKSAPKQNGSLEKLINFSTKNAFLTQDSKLYSNKILRDQILYRSQVFARNIDDDMIMIGTADVGLLKLFKEYNPTHMRLKAILPESKESYTCYPKIEVAP